MARFSGQITLGFASLAHAFAHLFILLYATVAVALERDWGISFDSLIALSVPGAVMFGLAALPAGWLGDRWSASGMMAVFFLGIGLAAGATGFATGPVGLLIGLTALGTVAAIYHPVGIPWLVRHAVNRGRALGLNGVFGSLGTASAAIIAGELTDLLGWRFAFWIPAGVALLVGAAFIAAIASGLIHEAKEDAAPAPEPERHDIKRAFLVLGVTTLCVGIVFQSLSFALPKIIDEQIGDYFGGGIAQVGRLVTLAYLISALSQIVGGELAHRFPLRRVYFWALAVQAPALILGTLVAGPAFVPVAVLFVSLNVLGQPSENALLARYTPPAWRGRVFGLKFVLTLGAGSAGVALVPVIYHATGSMTALLALLAGIVAIAGIAAWHLPRESATSGPAPVAAE